MWFAQLGRPSPVDRSVRNSPHDSSCGSSTASSETVAGVVERVPGPATAGKVDHVDLGQGTNSTDSV